MNKLEQIAFGLLLNYTLGIATLALWTPTTMQNIEKPVPQNLRMAPVPPDPPPPPPPPPPAR